MMYGAAARACAAMTFTSSPGFSLMLEGISYMIGAEVPGRVRQHHARRPGPRQHRPEQSDIKLACRGLGHGNTHAIVLAPSTPQEMLDLTMLAFELAFKYRNPVVILGDGYLGQMTGKVRLPEAMVKPGHPEWAVWGDAMHRRNLICSIYLAETDLEGTTSTSTQVRRDDRERAAGRPLPLRRRRGAGRRLQHAGAMAKGAVEELRALRGQGGAVPADHALAVPDRRSCCRCSRAKRIVVVEASAGQLEDELRLALSHAGVRVPPIESRAPHGRRPAAADEIVADAPAAGASRGVRE
jgi:2-oxoisovalerate ferredoxin oxidoreductase alpha subunit